MHRKINFALLVSLLASLPTLSACVNPSADYQAFVERTATMRGSDAAVSDVATNVADITGTWLGACMPQDIGDDPAFALIFYVDVKFTPDGEGGKIDISFTPLKDTATKMDMTQTSGATFGAKGVAASSKGAFDVVVGNVTIPGDAQRIGASTLQLTDVAFRSSITSKDRFCAEIDGQLTAPFKIDLSNPANHDLCGFRRVAIGADLPLVAGTTSVGFPKEASCH